MQANLDQVIPLVQVAKQSRFSLKGASIVSIVIGFQTHQVQQMLICSFAHLPKPPQSVL